MWVLTPLPKTFGWEYKPRSSLCTHAFSRTGSKILTFIYTRWGKAGNKKHTQLAPSTKTGCDYSVVGLRTVTYVNISPKMVNPRDIGGEGRRRSLNWEGPALQDWWQELRKQTCYPLCHTLLQDLETSFEIRLLLLPSKLYLWGFTSSCDFFLQMWPFFDPTIEVVSHILSLWMVHAGCIFVAGIYPSRKWMSGSFESVWWNACVHRLDLSLRSHLKE